MLAHTANQLVLPGLLNLKNTINELKSNWEQFKISQSDSAFGAVKVGWQTCVLKFHRVKIYEFGPSATIGLRAALGTFPTDTIKILDNAENSAINLNLSTNLDAIGFSALEYLFFRTNAKSGLASNTNLKAYVDKLLVKMLDEVTTVYFAWQNGYAEVFSNSSGTESTSGFSILINEFSKEYELAKNAKLGIPIGKQSLGIPQLNYVESPFAKISLLILKENIQALYDLFKGKGNNGIETVGFDDYLYALEKTELVLHINTGFKGIIEDLNTLDSDLIVEIQNNPSRLDQLYVNMQSLVVHLKTDMTSAFGVLITYQDNDGD